ncbi:MAG TPA: effector-associated domain EAD1-containing protein [Pyrinomonadaceae bacterium]
MSLTGKQSEELHKAILVAFPSKGDLARIVKHKLGQNLEEIATDGNLSTVVFTLIVWLESRNLVENFVVGAREDNPGNEDLRIFADNYRSDLGISNPRFADSETFEAAFERETRRARRQIKRTIPGLKTPVPRIEIEWLEEQ